MPTLNSPPLITTWFYAEHEGEESFYPQVGGRSSSPGFHAVYWRCVVDFFAASVRVNPEARHRFYTNQSVVAEVDGFDIRSFLDHLDIEVVVLPYASRPPAGYYGAWASQFYVLDIAAHLADTLRDGDVGLILDSDCVFTRSIAPLVSATRRHGALTFDTQMGPDEVRSGLSLREMGQIYAELGSGSRSDGGGLIPAYVGGEIVSATRETLVEITSHAQDILPEMHRRHEEGLPKFNEEAQLLSFIYHRLDLALGTANPFIDRMFTWFTASTVRPGHEDLMIWHLPNEKKLGLNRLFDDVRNDDSWFWTLEVGDEWRSQLGRMLGVPRRTPSKWIRDVGRTAVNKVIQPA